VSQNLVHKIVLTFLFTVGLVTAWNSSGFHHVDEHFQIIEFSGLKLGINKASDLAWEYKSQIRPAFQVLIAYVVFSASDFVGINSPFTKTFLLRLITLLFSWWTSWVFVNRFSKHFQLKKLEQHLLLYLMVGLWFIPFLSVRFSSETWGGIFLLLALAYAHGNHEKPSNLLWIGVFSGFSFICRNQMAFAIIPLILYLIYYFRESKKNIGSFVIGAFTALSLGVIIDYWFYGKLVFTALSNFYYNIIKGVASSFGEEGPAYYIDVIMHYPTLTLGFILLLCIITLLVFKPKNLLLWVVLSFVIGHSIIAHKEPRFLFPIAFLSGPIIFLAIRETLIRLNLSKNGTKLITFLAIILVGFNLVGSLVMFSSAAGAGNTEIHQYFSNKTQSGQHINMMHLSGTNPYNPISNLPIKFYQNPNLNQIHIKDLSQLQKTALKFDDAVPTFFVIRNAQLNNEAVQCFIKQNGFVLKNRSVPKWLSYINKHHASHRWGHFLLVYERTGINKSFLQTD